MSSLTPMEKRKPEQLFGMSSGCVLGFSNTTSRDFLVDTVEVDIHFEKHQSKGRPKAKKLREFWRSEPDHLVDKVVLSLLDHDPSPSSAALRDRTAQLRAWSPVKEAPAGVQEQFVQQAVARFEGCWSIDSAFVLQPAARFGPVG